MMYVWTVTSLCAFEFATVIMHEDQNRSMWLKATSRMKTSLYDQKPYKNLIHLSSLTYLALFPDLLNNFRSRTSFASASDLLSTFCYHRVHVFGVFKTMRWMIWPGANPASPDFIASLSRSDLIPPYLPNISRRMKPRWSSEPYLPVIRRLVWGQLGISRILSRPCCRHPQWNVVSVEAAYMEMRSVLDGSCQPAGSPNESRYVSGN